VPTGRVLLRVTNKHAGRRRRRRRYAQATTRSKTTQHSIHDSDEENSLTVKPQIQKFSA